jgi:hypothetical protein
MNDLNKEKLNELIAYLADATKAGLDKAPTVAAEIVDYQGIYSTVFLVLGSILLTVGIFSLAAGIRWAEKFDDDSFGIWAFFTLPSLVFGVTAVVYNTLGLIQVHYAPHLVILDYLK